MGDVKGESAVDVVNSSEADDRLQERRNQVYNLIRKCATNGGPYLIPVLMMLGKTYAAGNLSADPKVDRPVTALTKQIDTRKKIRNEAKEGGQDPSRIKLLPPFFEVCPTAAGEHDDIEIPHREESWSELVRLLHNNQVTPSYMHQRLGDLMPCQHGDKKCPYSAACDFDIEKVDLLIGHPIHANVERYVDGRITLFDEDAGKVFEYTVEESVYTRAINVLLEHHVDLDGATSKDDLISASEAQRGEWLDEILGEHDLLDPNIGYSGEGGRADAPLLAIAVLNGEYVGSPSMNLRRTEVGKITLLYDEGTDTDDPAIVVRNPPTPISGAWSVLAMDGTPTPEIWRNRLDLDLEYQEFMTDEERADFIERTLGYNIVQLTPDRTVSAAKAKNLNRDVLNGILWEIKSKHDRMVPTITSQQAKQSIIDGRYVSNKELHLGKVRSRSELEEETLLAVLGSLHPGDREIQRLAALDGYAVESNGEGGIDKSYGEVGDRYYRHLVHNEVAQSIFRVARTEETPGADIYVYTAIIPDWIPRTVVDENPRRWPRSIKDTARVLEEMGSATKDEIIGNVEFKKRTVDEALKTLRKHGHVEDEHGEGRYAKKEWKDVGLSERNPYAKVSLPDK